MMHGAGTFLRASGYVVAAILCSRPAFAQVDKSAAVALFDAAEQLVSEGKYAEACPKFAESNRLDPQLGVLLHLAECHEKLGQFASAWAAFRDAAELADRRADARSLSAKDRANALEAKLSRLTILVPREAMVPGLEVRRDNVLLGAPHFGTPIPVDPGEHVVDVTAPGKLAWRSSIVVSANAEAASVSVPVLEDAPTAPQATAGGVGARNDEGSATADRGATQRGLGWALAGAGVLGIGVGVLFRVQSSSKVSDRDAICPSGLECTPEEGERIQQLSDEADTAATIGTLSLVAGGLAAAGGVVLVLTAPTGESTASLRLSPILAPGFGGFSMTRTF